MPDNLCLIKNDYAECSFTYITKYSAKREGVALM